MTLGAFLFYALLLYGGAGVVTALLLCTYGAARIAGAPVTIGARLLFIPGAIALWPLVLKRWLQAGTAQ